MSKPVRVFFALLIINCAVLFHELGHFAAARLFNIEVDTISVGFGPAVASWTIRPGLVFRVGAIPLGGYVRISKAGMKEIKHRSPHVGAIVFSAGVLVNWFSPIIALALFSPFWRQGGKSRAAYPETIQRRDLLLKRKRQLRFIGPIFVFKALVAPMDDKRPLEEYAWKYTDFSRAIGFLNLLPFFGLDGDRMFSAMLNAFPLPEPLASAVAFSAFIGWLFLWYRLGHWPRLYRSLL